MQLHNNLFAYGTLCFASVMRQVANVSTPPVRARLKGFACFGVKGELYPAIVPHEGSEVFGLLYRHLKPVEIQRIDEYEGTLYDRVLLQIEYGRAGTVKAWTYVMNPGYLHKLDNTPWLINQFARHHLSRYKARNRWL